MADLSLTTSAAPVSAPTPNQAHVGSLKSTFICNNPSHSSNISVDHADVDNSGEEPLAVGVNVKGRVLVDKFLHWLSQRNKRRAKYPAPFDRYFKELDFGKLCTLLLGAMVTSMATFGQQYFNLISKECMRGLILKLISALFFLTVAYTLQDMIPEIAVMAMLGGIAWVVASFHTVVLNLLDLSKNQRHFALSILFLGYTFLLLITLHKLVKEDVREKEEIEEDGSRVSAV